MKKLKNEYIIMGVLLIALVYIGLNPASIIGGSALSIDKVETSEGNRIIYTVALDGSAGSGTITFTPQQALQYGFQIQEPITFSLDQSCRYQFTNQSNIVYSLDLKDLGERMNRCCGTIFQCCSKCEYYKCSQYDKNYYQTEISAGVKSAPSGCNFNIEYIKTYCTKYVSQGSAYELDPSNFFITNVKVKIGNGEEKVIELSTIKREAEIDGITVKIIGSLMGSQSCPNAGSEVIAYKKSNEDIFTLKDKIVYRQMDSMKKNTPANMVWSSGYNSYYNAFINSKSYLSDYCEIKETDLQGTFVECTPNYPVAIPMLQIIIDGDKVGMVIPDGEPKILSIEGNTPKETADITPIKVKFQNVGTTVDSFDVALICDTDVNPASKRYTLEKNEIKDVQIEYSGSGIIEECILSINSVNKPNNKDEEEVKVIIYPMCSKPQPSVNHKKVQTEYGCFWLCKNGYQLDVDNRCQPIDFTNPSRYKTDEEVCVGIGQYVNLYDYARGINKTLEGIGDYNVVSFVPTKLTNQHFIPAPYCNYVAEYGYEIVNGKAISINNLKFRYDNILPEGELIDLDEEQVISIPINEDEIDNGIIENGDDTEEDYTSLPSTEQLINNPITIIIGVIGAYILYIKYLKKIVIR